MIFKFILYIYNIYLFINIFIFIYLFIYIFVFIKIIFTSSLLFFQFNWKLYSAFFIFGFIWLLIFNSQQALQICHSKWRKNDRIWIDFFKKFDYFEIFITNPLLFFCLLLLRFLSHLSNFEQTSRMDHFL